MRDRRRQCLLVLVAVLCFVVIGFGSRAEECLPEPLFVAPTPDGTQVHWQAQDGVNCLEPIVISDVGDYVLPQNALSPDGNVAIFFSSRPRSAMYSVLKDQSGVWGPQFLVWPAGADSQSLTYQVVGDTVYLAFEVIGTGGARTLYGGFYSLCCPDCPNCPGVVDDFATGLRSLNATMSFERRNRIWIDWIESHEDRLWVAFAVLDPEEDEWGAVQFRAVEDDVRSTRESVRLDVLGEDPDQLDRSRK